MYSVTLRGKHPRPSDVMKSGGNTTPELYMVTDIQSDTAI